MIRQRTKEVYKLQRIMNLSKQTVLMSTIVYEIHPLWVTLSTVTKL